MTSGNFSRIIPKSVLLFAIKNKHKQHLITTKRIEL